MGDTHFGHAKFYEESLIQGSEALRELSKTVDIIIHAGDMFDIRLPTFNTLKDVIKLFQEIKRTNIPVVAIKGNHDRRSPGFVDSITLLNEIGLIIHKNWEVFSFEKNGETISILSIGNVPDDEARNVIEQVVEKNKQKMKGFKILVIHQNIDEYSPFASFNISFLESLGFDLIINGHIHKRIIERDLIIPGSTVATKLNEEELTEPRGYVVFDTKTKTAEKINIKNQRKGFYIKKVFKRASVDEVEKEIMETYNKIKSQENKFILKIKLEGTLKEGVSPSNVKIPNIPFLYIQNDLNSEEIQMKTIQLKEFRTNKINLNQTVEEKLNELLKDKMKLSPTRTYNELLEEKEDEWIEKKLGE